MNDDVFKKYFSKIKRESVLNSALCGLSVGFAALAITAFICWMTEFTPVWICPVVFAVASGVAFALFYAFKFRPTFQKVAARMDALGLDERMITMHEFSGDTSVMAGIQRADAVACAGGVSAKLLKIVVSTAIIVTACVSVAFGATTLTVDALSEAGVIKSGKQVVDEIANPTKEFTLSYIVEGKGKIFVVNEKGEEKDVKSITVTEGENGQLVDTKPEEGWFLAGWKVNGENYKMGDPYRREMAVDGEITLTAVFEELDYAEGDEMPPPLGKGSSNSSGGGSSIDRTDSTMVNNGDTYYGDTYGQDFENAMNSASGNDSLSSGDLGLIGGYFDTIAP